MEKQTRIDSSVIRRWPSSATRRWFESFGANIVKDDNVLALVAVGSTVRSNVRSDDLDLVVICRDCKQFHYKAPIEVDVRTFEAARVEAELSSGHPLLGWAVRFGMVVFDRSEMWKAQAQPSVQT
jgi:predicted nucleotidyltransferase